MKITLETDKINFEIDERLRKIKEINEEILEESELLNKILTSSSRDVNGVRGTVSAICQLATSLRSMTIEINVYRNMFYLAKEYNDTVTE